MARSKQATAVSLTFVDELIRRYLELEREIDALRSTRERIASQLRVALEVSPEHALATPSGAARLVVSDVVTYDLDMLRQEVRPELLALMARCQIDRELAEASAALGAIPSGALDRARRITRRKPQLRVSGATPGPRVVPPTGGL